MSTFNINPLSVIIILTLSPLLMFLLLLLLLFSRIQFLSGAPLTSPPPPPSYPPPAYSSNETVETTLTVSNDFLAIDESVPNEYVDHNPVSLVLLVCVIILLLLLYSIHGVYLIHWSLLRGLIIPLLVHCH